METLSSGYTTSVFYGTLIHRLCARLHSHPKRIVFPEGRDPRIIQSARQLAKQELSVPILLGDRTVIKERAYALNVPLENIAIIDPLKSDERPAFLQWVSTLHYPAATREQIAQNPTYFAGFLLKNFSVDAMVAGATTEAANALVPIFRTIPHRTESASSLLILENTEKPHGLFFMADCGVIPCPTAQQQADIALSTAALAYHLTTTPPRIAFLSYTSHSEKSNDPSILKIKEAVSITRARAATENIPGLAIDGELQADTALDPMVAQHKAIESPVAGRANVLIFPDLHCGNITSKMLQVLGGMRTYGQILTGLTRPVAEISRGATAHDIFGTSVITAALAVDRHILYPDA